MPRETDADVVPPSVVSVLPVSSAAEDASEAVTLSYT